ncbi:CynX/NimT family MFS transporter [uncultured Pseudokineococcus sp.]|uniref:MFS transporter n=1 Tax=uncultured Pseudokineococcus sp. TaxID=1642928 RepID=UPI00262ECBF6|nr:MFS transporter [uncultured Pseudokineococcus sp.]
MTGRAPAGDLAARTGRAAPPTALVIAAVLVVALSLRGPIVAVAPVLGRLTEDLGLGPSTAGLLTTIPVVCFALAAPLASALIARVGPGAAVWWCLAGVAAGTALRSSGGTEVVLAGTAVIGTAITVGNIVVPVIIRRSVPPSRTGAATGAYTAALNVGSMLTSLGTEPLAQLLGWRAATASWAVLALAGAVLWGLATLRRRPLAAEAPRERGAEDAPAPTAPAHRPAWAPAVLTVGFGAQAFAYYGLTAWMPTLLADRLGQSPAEAGAASSVFQVMAVVGALGVPVLLARSSPERVLGPVGACWLALPVGLLLAPELWLVWTALGGAAQGGVFTLVFVLVVRLSSDDRQARRTSALVQGGGYALAALGPSVVGVVHDATGGWDAPLVVVAGALLVLVLATGSVALTVGRGAARA